MFTLGPGATLGRYRLESELGRGGMGTVYRAHDSELGREVALKVLSPLLAGDPGFVERFRREARLAAGLRHSNIVVVHDWGSQDGVPYLVMELLDGVNLATLIRREGRLPLSTVSSLVRQCAAALDYAHQHGVVHRDVKPGNVMVAPSGEITLTDFGIARATSGAFLTSTGGIVGTPAYLSPEQAMGQLVDGRSDVYSLGIMVYEVLVGRVPFQADSTPAVLHLQVYAPPTPLRELRPELPLTLAAVVERALAKDPAQRYATAGEFTAELEPLLHPANLADQTIVSTGGATPSPWTPVTGPPLSHPTPVRRWLGFGLLGLAVLAGGAYLTSNAPGRRTEPTPTVARASASGAVGAGTSAASPGLVAGLPASASPVAAAVTAAPLASPPVDPVLAQLREGDRLFPQDLGQAAAAYRRAAELGPSSGLARRQLGIALFWQDRREALAELEQATRLEPNDGVAWAYLSLSYLDNLQYDAATVAAERARQLAPDDPATHAVNARQASLQNDVTTARTEADRAGRAGSALELSSWVNLIVLQDEDRYDEVLPVAQDLARQRPNWAVCYRYIGWALFLQDRYDESRQAYDRALAIDPDMRGVYAEIGQILLYEGKLDEAKGRFEQELQRDARGYWALNGLGQVALRQDRAEDALIFFRRALTINPRSGEAYDGIGWALTDGFDQHLEAEANFRKAIEIWPRYADAHYGLGVTQYRREQYEPALTSLQTARSHSPKDANITMWVGAALRELGRFPEARTMLEKALTLRPGDETIQDELEELASQGG